MGNRPQEIINQQMVRHCDLMVAIFWTHLGQSTGKEKSGTVEEINEFRKANKPVMLYFSKAPIDPDLINSQQWDAVKHFKRECQTEGLYQDYRTLDEFKNIFERQLTQRLNQSPFQHSHLAKDLGENPDDSIYLDSLFTYVQERFPNHSKQTNKAAFSNLVERLHAAGYETITGLNEDIKKCVHWIEKGRIDGWAANNYGALIIAAQLVNENFGFLEDEEMLFNAFKYKYMKGDWPFSGTEEEFISFLNRGYDSVEITEE